MLVVRFLDKSGIRTIYSALLDELGVPCSTDYICALKKRMADAGYYAPLCRKYEKGRDWYDFLWYLGNKTPVNYRRLSAALDQSDTWEEQGRAVDRAWYIVEMKRRIGEMDWKRSKDDVAPFISPQE